MMRLLLLILACITICSTESTYKRVETLINFAENGIATLKLFADWQQDIFKANVKGSIQNVTPKSVALSASLTPKIMKLLKPNTLQKLAKTFVTLNKIASALGPVSTIFSFVTMFIPSGPSEELMAIENGFKDVNVRFDKLELRLDSIDTEIKKLVYQRFNDLHENFETTRVAYSRFITNTTDSNTRKSFINSCREPLTDPSNILVKLNFLVLGRNDTLGNKFMDVILEETEYNFPMVRQYFSTIMTDAINVAMLSHICLGLRAPTDYGDHRQAALESQSLITDINNKLHATTDRLFKYAIEVQLEKDVKQELKNTKGMSNANFLLHIHSFLQTKYSWLLWNVYVINSIDRQYLWTKNSTNSRSFWGADDERNLVITWADRNSYKINKGFVHNIRDYIGGLQDFIPCHEFDIKSYPTDILGTEVYPSHNYPAPQQNLLEILNMLDTYLIVDNVDIQFIAADNTIYFRFCRLFFALSVV